MNLLAGLDSAYEPTAAQISAAWQQGYRVWALYVAGAGALHNWSSAGIARVRAGGFHVVPIFVPRLDLSTGPVSDAQWFMAACQAFGLAGAGVLDTEASMRGNPRLAHYEATFGDVLIAAGWAAGTYAGGFTLANPPKHAPWWIGVPARDGTADQSGQGSIGGLGVDFDTFGAGYPMVAPSVPPPPPGPVPAPIVNAFPTIPGGPMPSVTMTVPLSGGRGWVLLDGSDARVGHLKVPWSEYVSLAREGGFPPVDGYWDGEASPTDRNGFVAVEVTGAGLGVVQRNVVLVTSSTPAAALEAEVQDHRDAGRLITMDNWESMAAPIGGGQHEPVP